MIIVWFPQGAAVPQILFAKRCNVPHRPGRVLLQQIQHFLLILGVFAFAFYKITKAVNFPKFVTVHSTPNTHHRTDNVMRKKKKKDDM